MTNLRSLPLRALAGAALTAVSFSVAAIAQQAAPEVRPEVRIVTPIDENQLVTLHGNVIPAANAHNDRGPVSSSLPMQDLVLVLSRSPEQQAAFDAYVQGEYDSGSPYFHQWLTADQIGERFGPSLADIATITNWLASQGFTVSHTAKDRMSITFSGTAGLVQSAFHTSIHHLSVNGVAHIANMINPQIPAALAPVVVGIKQLHDFHPHPLHKVGSVVQFNHELGKWQRVGSPGGSAASLSPLSIGASASAKTAGPRPLFTFPATSDTFAEEDVSPNDFATIYNVQPLWNADITGTNQIIAIAGTSDICLGQSGSPCNSTNDVSSYKSAFSLPAGTTPEEIKGANGYDPGVCTSTSSTAVCSINDLEENTLDVEVSGGVAPGAQVVLVTSGYNTDATNDPIQDDAQYIEENINNSSSPLNGARIMSVSYGQCELGEGTTGNVDYYNLWQTAAAEGLAVFVASGDSGSPSCDDGGDTYGNPYSAQYGLSVSGLASTPFNTAVGGTDFSWCQPTVSGSNVDNCPTSAASNDWNYTSNNSNNSSAKGYVPEIPWNDTCENPILGKYLETYASASGISGVSTPEEACNFVENDWYEIYESILDQYGEQDAQESMLAGYVDTVGGSGGESNCVVNNDSSDQDNPSCTTSATSVNVGSSTVNLSNDGWPVPSWQTGITGTSSLTSRGIPDVSFFSGDGALDSATLICLETVTGGDCTASTVADTALEIGGTSVATPEMAGVMALINQKAGASQGLPNKQLYELATKQTYSSCSAESVTTSSSCYFQSIDEGTNAMPCSLGEAGAEGGAIYTGNGWYVDPDSAYTGAISPNCTAINSADAGGIGTLISSGTTPAYNATAGYNLATGLGSLNVANVVNAWVSNAGTHTATVTAQLSATKIAANTALTVTVTVTGNDGPPTGNVTVSGGGANGTGTLNSSGVATVTIPANSLAVGSDTLTIAYGGDSTYASANTTASVTVSAIAPTVAVNAPTTVNSENALTVTVTVSGPLGSATPTGTVTLTAGSYSSSAATLSSQGTASITIPANTLSAGAVTLTATYSGDTTYTSATGSEPITVVTVTLLTPTITVTPAKTSIDSGQSLAVVVNVSGSGAVPTGTVSLSAGTCTASTAACAVTALGSGNANASFTIPANSLSAPSATITATYSGDAVYAAGTGSASVTVTASAYALTATTPAAISPGSTATSTITGNTSSTDYTGTVTLNSCTLTTSSVTNPTDPPSCSITGTITYANGTATGSGTATVTTTNTTAMLNIRPGSKGWLRAAGGTALAFLLFFGIPARRRSWRGLLGMVILLASLGGLSACGGGSSSGGGGGGSSTSAGTYTFTVTGQGSDPASTSESTTFTVTVN